MTRLTNESLAGRSDGKLSRKEGPVRMCVICRRRLPKNDLLCMVRRTWHKEQDLSGDDNDRLLEEYRQNKSGRGWYLCRDSRCLEKMKRYPAWWKKVGGTRDNG